MPFRLTKVPGTLYRRVKVKAAKRKKSGAKRSKK